MPPPSALPALHYARPKVAWVALLALGVAIPVAAFALALRGNESVSDLQELYVFYLLGAHGPRIAMAAAAAAVLVIAFSLIARLFNRRPAAALRPGGIALNGGFRPRFIPWASLEQAGLHHSEYKGSRRTYLKFSWRRLPGDESPAPFPQRRSARIPIDLIAATPDEIAAWLRAMHRARPKPVFAPLPAARGWRPLLGRRAT